MPALLPEADAVRRLLLQVLPGLLLSEADALPQSVLRLRLRRLLREADAVSLPATAVRADRALPEVGTLPAVRANAATRAVRRALALVS